MNDLQTIITNLCTQGYIHRINEMDRHGYCINDTFYNDSNLTVFWTMFYNALRESHSVEENVGILLQKIITDTRFDKITIDDMLNSIDEYYSKDDTV